MFKDLKLLVHVCEEIVIFSVLKMREGRVLKDCIFICSLVDMKQRHIARNRGGTSESLGKILNNS